MKLGTFIVNSPFGNTYGTAMIVNQNDSLYDELINLDEDELPMKAYEEMVDMLESLGKGEVIPDSYVITWQDFEDSLVCCIFDDNLPQGLIERAADFVHDHPEMLQAEYPNAASEKERTNCYRLNKLSDLYRIPSCKGKVLQNYKGQYILETSSLLDDFLAKENDDNKQYKEVVLESVEDFFEKD